MPSQGAESDLSFIVEQSLSMSRVDRRQPLPWDYFMFARHLPRISCIGLRALHLSGGTFAMLKVAAPQSQAYRPTSTRDFLRGGIVSKKLVSSEGREKPVREDREAKGHDDHGGSNRHPYQGFVLRRKIGLWM
jgi:hypothetical protein